MRRQPPILTAGMVPSAIKLVEAARLIPSCSAASGTFKSRASMCITSSAVQAHLLGSRRTETAKERPNLWTSGRLSTGGPRPGPRSKRHGSDSVGWERRGGQRARDRSTGAPTASGSGGSTTRIQLRAAQASTGCRPTKKEVSGKLRDMVRRVEAGSAARDDSTLFGVFAARWLESSLPASDRKETTKVLYAGLARTHILASDLGRLSMKDMRPSSVERFVTQLRAKGLSESTVRQVYTVARAIGEAAMRDGRMAKNPFAAVRRPRVTPVEARFLEPFQIHALLVEASDSRYRLLLRVPGSHGHASWGGARPHLGGHRPRGATCARSRYVGPHRWPISRSSSRSQPSPGA